MAMSDEVRVEYERVLIAVVLRHGSVVDRGPGSYHGWQDYDRTTHLRECTTATHGAVAEATWHEFKGTFDEGDDSVHGVQVTHVTCACGQLSNVTVRWSARMQEIAEAVFVELYESMRR